MDFCLWKLVETVEKSEHSPEDVIPVELGGSLYDRWCEDPARGVVLSCTEQESTQRSRLGGDADRDSLSVLPR